ncbi:MAG: alkylation response protein AidB-like acyl-CoA dehydrogenase [Bacteroidia bacterium]|jgi:alkylation response protein AidB-like acyl-CoA dehydrogenase
MSAFAGQGDFCPGAAIDNLASSKFNDRRASTYNNTSLQAYSVDFSLSEEQVLLRDSVEKYVTDNCGVERHRRLADSELGFDPQAWQQFADLGWLAVPFTEDQGGFDGGATELMVICQALGGALVREPYLATLVTCGNFLRAAGSEAQQADYVPGIIDGSEQWGFAFAEQHGGYDLTHLRTRGSASHVLDGEKVAVLNGHCADRLIVSARTGGADNDPAGISLFIVDATAKGVTRRPFIAVDGSRAADIRFDGVQLGSANVLGEAGQALALMEAVIDKAIVAMGAEALGAMQVLLDATVEYTKTREQFGQPIGKFQALQHRMADMFLKVQETRSLLLHAAIRIDENSDEAASACAALKVKLCEAGRFVMQEAVQLHGGMGMTDELVVGHHYKRLMLLSKLYGDEAYYLRRFAALSKSQAA